VLDDNTNPPPRPQAGRLTSPVAGYDHPIDDMQSCLPVAKDAVTKIGGFKRWTMPSGSRLGSYGAMYQVSLTLVPAVNRSPPAGSGLPARSRPSTLSRRGGCSESTSIKSLIEPATAEAKPPLTIRAAFDALFEADAHADGELPG